MNQTTGSLALWSPIGLSIAQAPLLTSTITKMINLDLGGAYIRSFKWSNSNLDQVCICFRLLFLWFLNFKKKNELWHLFSFTCYSPTISSSRLTQSAHCQKRKQRLGAIWLILSSMMGRFILSMKMAIYSKMMSWLLIAI